MKRVIVTNNQKVEDQYAGKAEVIMLKNASVLEVLQEGEKLAMKGGKLMLDPTRRKGFYKSLILLMDEKETSPDKNSLELIKSCIKESGGQGSNGNGKEPILSGILQKRDLDLVKSVLH